METTKVVMNSICCDILAVVSRIPETGCDVANRMVRNCVTCGREPQRNRSAIYRDVRSSSKQLVGFFRELKGTKRPLRSWEFDRGQLSVVVKVRLVLSHIVSEDPPLATSPAVCLDYLFVYGTCHQSRQLSIREVCTLFRSA